ncbi:4-hydroxy-3-methylbut-2-enyl diphosphate reductase [Candidatus Saganbacteria bacterium]|nr:4-hydroxy-3-methylbut-2-enyl diphosphate reductase [Candidatus Saganbacteria bacterium]
MKILIAEHSGFCEGVERAYQLALEEAHSGQQIFMLGNLVHNRAVIEKLKAFGVKTVKTLNEIPPETKGILLISAHGVAPQIYEGAKAKGLKVVDTTCPWVKRAQQIAKALAESRKKVLIVGDKGHAEVTGLVGWSNNQAIVVEKLANLEQLKINKTDQIGILAQTTQPEEKFKAIVDAVKKISPHVAEYVTICGATHKRQSACIELAKKADVVLVIGDPLSANTKRLTELSSATSVETHQIETAAGLQKSWLRGKETIGITAGASTPDWVIDEVVKALAPAPSEHGKNSIN